MLQIYDLVDIICCLFMKTFFVDKKLGGMFDLSVDSKLLDWLYI